MPLIEDIDKATEEIETPRSFIQWATIAAVSAVLKKNVWFPKHAYQVYPNIYVLIVGQAAIRKGYAIGVAKRLVSLANNTRVISGRNSIQSILKELSTSQTNEDGSPLRTKAQAFICTGELANLLIEDKQAHTILTELYNTHENEDKWENTLKGSGKETLTEPCLTFLAASNQKLLMESLPMASYEGGLIGRIMVIEENRRRVINSLMDAPKVMIDWAKAKDDLLLMSALRGPYSFDSEITKHQYINWYENFDIEGIDDNTGTAGRMADHILKLCMVLAATRRMELKITRKDLDEAMDLCMTSTRNIKMVIGKQGSAQMSRQTHIVLRELLNAQGNKIKKSALLRKHYGDFDSLDLGRIIDTLVAANAVEISNISGETWYLLQDRVVDSYKNLLGSK